MREPLVPGTMAMAFMSAFPFSACIFFRIAESKLHSSRLSQPLQQVVSHAQRIGDDGQAGIHGCDRYKEACVDDIEIIQIVRLAVQIERRRS